MQKSEARYGDAAATPDAGQGRDTFGAAQPRPGRRQLGLARAGLCGAVLSLLSGVPAMSATVEVVVTGVRNDKGNVRVAICSPAQFLKPTCDHVGQVGAKPGEVVVRVEGVPPGVWAAQVFHDEDGDGKIDTNLFKLPTEGLGFSNDARFRLGPPRYADAAFQLQEPAGRIRVSLRYDF